MNISPIKISNIKLLSSSEPSYTYALRKSSNDLFVRENKGYEVKIENKLYFFSESGIIQKIREFKPGTDFCIKQTEYYPNGTAKMIVTDYDERTGKQKMSIKFYEDGQKVKSINDYYPETGIIKRRTKYREDQSIRQVRHHDEKGTLIKKIYMFDDGQTPEFIREYNPDTTVPVRGTRYRLDGTLEASVEYNPKTGLKSRLSKYRATKQTRIMTTDYNEQGERTKITFYNSDGVKINGVKYLNSRLN